MKVVLDLKHTYNHYHWEDKEELTNYIDNMKYQLWKFYNDNILEEEMDDDILNRLYDILDMFNSFEIVEKGEE